MTALYKWKIRYDSPHMDVVMFDIRGWVQKGETESVKLQELHVVNSIRYRIDELKKRRE